MLMRRHIQSTLLTKTPDIGANLEFPHSLPLIHHDLALDFLDRGEYQHAIDHLGHSALLGHIPSQLHIQQMVTQRWSLEITTHVDKMIGNLSKSNTEIYRVVPFFTQQSPSDMKQLLTTYSKTKELPSDFSELEQDFQNLRKQTRHQDPLMAHLNSLFSFPKDGGSSLIQTASTTYYPSSLLSVLQLELPISPEEQHTYFSHIKQLFVSDILFQYGDISQHDSLDRSHVVQHDDPAIDKQNSVVPPTINDREYFSLVYRAAFPNYKSLFQKAVLSLKDSPPKESSKYINAIRDVNRAAKCEYLPALNYMIEQDLTFSNILL